MTMLKNDRLVLVGGTGRNVGKTEFVCRLITSLAGKYTVYGLKVSTILPDEIMFHGNHEPTASANSALYEENNRNTHKDTSRMLRAGASRVFYLQGEDATVGQGYDEFDKLLPEDAVVVCESNSLRNHVTPVLHIVVTNQNRAIKPRAVKLLDLADVVIDSHGKHGFPELEEISLSLDRIWSDSE